MTAPEQLDALRREIDELFPAAGAQARVLAHPLTELARLLDAGDAAALGPALDRLEDLLEALMREAGWPHTTRMAK